MTLYSNSSSPLHADKSFRFFRDTYITLGSVENAYNKVHDNDQFNEFLRRLGILLDTFNCDRNFGAFLLHRHFHPEQEQIPLEQQLPWGEINEPALVTRMQIPDSSMNFAPCRWRYNSHTDLFEALEYSSDPHVIQKWSQLLESPQLLSEVAKLLKEFKLIDLIGFTIAKRSLPKLDHEHYLEISDSFERASVIRVDNNQSPPAGDGQIPTVWIPTVSCWCESDSLCWSIGCVTVGSKHIGDPDGDTHNEAEGPHNTVPCV